MAIVHNGMQAHMQVKPQTHKNKNNNNKKQTNSNQPNKTISFFF